MLLLLLGTGPVVRAADVTDYVTVARKRFVAVAARWSYCWTFGIIVAVDRVSKKGDAQIMAATRSDLKERSH